MIQNWQQCDWFMASSAIAGQENMGFWKLLRVNVSLSIFNLVTGFYFSLYQIILLNWKVLQIPLVIKKVTHLEFIYLLSHHITYILLSKDQPPTLAQNSGLLISMTLQVGWEVTPRGSSDLTAPAACSWWTSWALRQL